MKFSISLIRRKQTASRWIVGFMLAVAPLWLMLAVDNTSAHAQASNDAVPSSTSASTTSSPADWTQFHRDNMQRWNPYETVLGVGNVGGLQLKWSYASSFFSGSSSPAVVNGVVYFADQAGDLYALNASTGVKLWSFNAAGPVESSPAVVNGVLYVGSLDGNLYALNAATGALLWKNTSNVESSPTVVNGVVYFGSLDHNVYALNASTGAKLWSYSTGNEVLSSPAVANGVVYFGSFDHKVYALNASTGSKLWSFTTGHFVRSSPSVANGVVYIGGEDGNLYALSGSTGAKLWSYNTGNVQSSPAVANGMVFVSSEDNYLYALNASTGALVWSYTTAEGFAVSSPAVANGVLYVGSYARDVYALNASTGASLWKYPNTENPVFSSPTVVDGTLYVNSGPHIYAFSLGADLFLRVQPSSTTVHQGDLLTYAFPVWNLGPGDAVHEVLNTQVPAGTTFNYIRMSGTPGLGTCTHPPYLGTGQIICHENASMVPNTTWTVRLTVRVTAPSGTVITESGATLADNPDPNMANNTATVSTTVQ